MSNFWDFEVWGWMILMAVLLGSLLVGNILKKTIPFLQQSLIPTSVLGGAILLIVAAVYKAITGNVMFDTAAFNHNGTNNMEIITYHALALGFIASSFKTSGGKLNIYYEDTILQLKGDKRFNAVKYVHLFHRYKNLKRGNDNEQFLGL